MANTALTLQSSNEELKAYFEAVCRIVDSNRDEFPINLDEVWPLVYADKSKAVRALTTSTDFIQDVDYRVLTQNGENPLGGRPVNEYHLSTSCFEFFIARKVRPVFEVYRQFFHGVRRGEIRPQIPQTYSEALRLAADQAERIEKQERLIEHKDGIIGKLQPLADFAKTAFTSDTLVSISQAAKILRLPFGRNTLFKKLRESGIFFKSKNEPKQKYCDADYFRVVERSPIETSNGLMIPVTVYCTQKGLAYINLKFGKGRNNVPQLAKIV